jgi:hypothetical protein
MRGGRQAHLTTFPAANRPPAQGDSQVLLVVRIAPFWPSFCEDRSMASLPLVDDPATSEHWVGIPFDGRAYHYRQYSYDRVEDALNYAKAERARPDFDKIAPTCMRWRQFLEPTAHERAQMAEHGIAYQDGYFFYGPYRYDVLANALDYAEREPGLQPQQACTT